VCRGLPPPSECALQGAQNPLPRTKVRGWHGSSL
jgi:hypothetical protein